MNIKPGAMSDADKAIVIQITTFFEYLYGRWRDEREYEDFKDYKAAMVKSMPFGVTLDTMTARPFSITFTMGKVKRMLRVRRGSIELLRMRAG